MAPWREKSVLEQVSWQELWPCGGPTLESRLFLKDYTQWEGTMLKQFVKSCRLWEGTHIREAPGGLSSLQDSSYWSKRRAWRVLPQRKKEQQKWCVINWLHQLPARGNPPQQPLQQLLYSLSTFSFKILKIYFASRKDGKQNHATGRVGWFLRLSINQFGSQDFQNTSYIL